MVFDDGHGGPKATGCPTSHTEQSPDLLATLPMTSSFAARQCNCKMVPFRQDGAIQSWVQKETLLEGMVTAGKTSHLVLHKHICTSQQTFVLTLSCSRLQSQKGVPDRAGRQQQPEEKQL